MDQDHEQRVRERAYFLWHKEGCPEGQAEFFWQRAELLEQQESEPAMETPLSAAMAGNEVDEALEETFPASDPPSFVAAAKSKPKSKSEPKKK